MQNIIIMDALYIVILYGISEVAQLVWNYWYDFLAAFQLKTDSAKFHDENN